MSAPTALFDGLGPNTSTIERWETWTIRLSQIKEREGHNPRADYGEHDGTFASLMESIRERGVLEPPRLMPIYDSRGEWDYKDTDFYVVHGHRRVAAARALGLECITCIVPDAEGVELTYYTEGQQLVDALVENLQRKELNCVEVAEGIARLEKLGKTQAEIARWIGRDQGRVSKTVRLLELPVGVRALLRERTLSASHG
ncbi:ParB/RepB/Spo0J family partition protein, partial [Armatimonas sp.]|uniref:ParB/RepB/Spo0J family partition protein n=1 Tax=Armatimonas sp. TaxID=1872638 RepID=UPI003752B329